MDDRAQLIDLPAQPLNRSRARAGDASERVLAARAADGDEQAFRALVDRFGGPILALCVASVGDRTEAEDLAQEVFLAAWRGLPRYRGESSVSTWLFALARNHCVDRARRVGARPRTVLLAERHEPAAPVHAPARDLARGILAAAAALSLPLRQALLLRDLQGLSYEEIAQLQAVPLGTVRSRIAAARAAVADAARGQ